MNNFRISKFGHGLYVCDEHQGPYQGYLWLESEDEWRSLRSLVDKEFESGRIWIESSSGVVIDEARIRRDAGYRESKAVIAMTWVSVGATTLAVAFSCYAFFRSLF